MPTNLASALQSLRPVQVPDATQRIRTLADARAMQQQEEMRGLQIEGARSEQEAAQQAQAKAQAVHEVLKKYGGDFTKALPEIMQIDPIFGRSIAEADRKAGAETRKMDLDEAQLRETRNKNAFDQMKDQFTMAQPKPAQLVPPGSGVLQPGETQPSYTQPFAPRTQVPGTDIPLPPEVEAQRARISQAGRAPAAPEAREVIVGPDGKPVIVPASQSFGKTPVVSSQNKPPTEGERTALRFYERMKGASDDLAAVEEGIANLGLGGQARLAMAPNVFQTNEGQLYQQAQRAFTEARLRKDSGAAIPEGEFENDRRMYFVQPGDKPDVIAQKRRARETVMNALRRSAARAYEETYGESPAKIGADSSVPVVMTDKDGVSWEVPPEKVRLFEENGFKRR